MKTYALALVVGSTLVVNGAVAQPSAPPQITPEQRDVIRKHILHEARPSIAMAADLVPATGARMPENVELFWMPPSTGLNRYRYAVVNQRTFVVDHHDRRVVEILVGIPERP